MSCRQFPFRKRAATREAPFSSWFGLSLPSVRVLGSSFCSSLYQATTPSIRNMGWIGRGRNYVRGNKCIQCLSDFPIYRGRQQQTRGWKAHALDSLKSVAVYHWLEG